MSVCQEDCELSQYDKEKKIVECSCNVKESSSSFADMKIDKAKLLENFKDIKNIINYQFLICYKKLFRKDGIMNNIGCYILLTIILFHIISIFIFYLNDFSNLKKKINGIIFGMNEAQINGHNEKPKKNKYKSNNKSKKISIHKKDKKRKTKKKIDFKYKNPIDDNSKGKI